MGLPARHKDALPDGLPSPELYEDRSYRLIPVLWRLLAVLIVASAIVGAIGVFRYEPMMGGAGPAPSGTATIGGQGGTYTVAYAPGTSFEYGFSVQNAGRWGVTVTGIEPPAHPTFADVEILAEPPGGTLGPAGEFALPAGESARVVIRVSFASCRVPPPVGAREAWSSETLNFRFAAVSREQAVPLPFAIAIDDAAASAC